MWCGLILSATSNTYLKVQRPDLNWHSTSNHITYTAPAAVSRHYSSDYNMDFKSARQQCLMHACPLLPPRAARRHKPLMFQSLTNCPCFSKSGIWGLQVLRSIAMYTSGTPSAQILFVEQAVHSECLQTVLCTRRTWSVHVCVTCMLTHSCIPHSLYNTVDAWR